MIEERMKRDRSTTGAIYSNRFAASLRHVAQFRIPDFAGMTSIFKIPCTYKSRNTGRRQGRPDEGWPDNCL